jgi:hypothetical protein
MDLTRYVENLRRELAVAAEAGGEDARALAERLTGPLEAAVRLTLLDALSTAADEITADLAPVSVDLRLRGGQPEFVVTPSPVDQPLGGADADAEPEIDAGPDVPAGPPTADLDEGPITRINLRLPEQLKARLEAAATREGLSANAWLVRAVATALDRPPRDRGPRPTGHDRRFTGWVR